MQSLPVTIVTGASEAVLAGLALERARIAVVLHDPSAAGEPAPMIGCACCRVRGGLAPAMLGLLRGASRGESAAFDRVLVSAPRGEAAATLLELLASPATAAAFRVASVVALGDGDGDDAAIADHVRRELAGDAFDWLAPRALPESLMLPREIRASHDQAVEAFVLGWNDLQPLARVGEWLEALAAANGERLLRVHGLATTGEGAYALQAVRHVVGPPARIEAAGHARLRFVTRGLEPGDLLPPWPCGAAR